MFKSIVRALVGQKVLGALQLLRNPASLSSWGGPFNGQRYRQRIFFDLLYAFPVQAIVETGTFQGTTTALFAATALPVYTTEISGRYFTYSRLRFAIGGRNVHVFNLDSRAFLAALRDDSAIPREYVFFYLDAHWMHDLPLGEELDLIFSSWRNSIVMIDDFSVPGSGYAFDSYGSGNRIDLQYIEPAVRRHGLSVFFPAIDAADETGAKTGCAVLCPSDLAITMERSVATLRKSAPPDAKQVA